MKVSLAEIQSSVHKSIMEGSADAHLFIKAPHKGSVAVAFRVYQDAYTLRLGGFLAHDFPMLKAYAGDALFNEMAIQYIKANPSSHPNARWFADRLPQFLRTWHAFANCPEGLELALLEQALARAFDAEDVQPLSLADLAALAPERAGDLQLRLQPSATVLTFHQNTTSIWSALKTDAEPPHPHLLDKPQDLLIFRQNQASRFRLLGEEESMALACIRDGLSFAVLCEMMAFQNDDGEVPQRAAMYLRVWVESQLLVADSADKAAK